MSSTNSCRRSLHFLSEPCLKTPSCCEMMQSVCDAHHVFAMIVAQPPSKVEQFIQLHEKTQYATLKVTHWLPAFPRPFLSEQPSLSPSITNRSLALARYRSMHGLRPSKIKETSAGNLDILVNTPFELTLPLQWLPELKSEAA